jgi:hypothetical protein
MPMSDWLPPSDDAIRYEAYLLWEADGRRFGRDYEYWMRASGVLSERAQHAAACAAEAAEAAARHAVVDELAGSGWARGVPDKPLKVLWVPRPRRLPQMRGPATRPVRVRSKTA